MSPTTDIGKESLATEKVIFVSENSATATIKRNAVKLITAATHKLRYIVIIIAVMLPQMSCAHGVANVCQNTSSAK